MFSELSHKDVLNSIQMSVLTNGGVSFCSTYPPETEQGPMFEGWLIHLEMFRHQVHQATKQYNDTIRVYVAWHWRGKKLCALWEHPRILKVQKIFGWILQISSQDCQPTSWSGEQAAIFGRGTGGDWFRGTAMAPESITVTEHKRKRFQFQHGAGPRTKFFSILFFRSRSVTVDTVFLAARAATSSCSCQAIQTATSLMPARLVTKAQRQTLAFCEYVSSCPDNLHIFLIVLKKNGVQQWVSSLQNRRLARVWGHHGWFMKHKSKVFFKVLFFDILILPRAFLGFRWAEGWWGGLVVFGCLLEGSSIFKPRIHHFLDLTLHCGLHLTHWRSAQQPPWQSFTHPLLQRFHGGVAASSLRGCPSHRSTNTIGSQSSCCMVSSGSLKFHITWAVISSPGCFESQTPR